MGWKGILIEADPESLRKLVKRNRKSWALPVCLSPKPYPVKVRRMPTVIIKYRVVR